MKKSPSPGSGPLNFAAWQSEVRCGSDKSMKPARVAGATVGAIECKSLFNKLLMQRKKLRTATAELGSEIAQLTHENQDVRPSTVRHISVAGA